MSVSRANVTPAGENFELLFLITKVKASFVIIAK